MLKILINNTKQFITVDQTPNINITNHEVGELATITTPYSGVIELERTPYNISALGGYSILQLTSSLPYSLIYGDVYIDDYFIGKYRIIIQKYTETKIYLNLSDNSKFFWDNIQKATLGKTIQLTELMHSKDASTIQQTWSNDLPYKYLIGDYGGLNSYIVNGSEHNNIDFAQPSVRVSYLLDKLIKDAGLTSYTGVDMSKDFIVYPNSTEYEKVEGDSTEVGKIRTNTHLNYSDSSDGFFPIPFDSSDTLNQPNIKINNDTVNTIEILKSGTFDFFFEGDCEARYYYEDNWGDREMAIESVVAGIYVNGEMTLKMTSIPYKREAKVSIILNAGDVVEIYNIPEDRNYPNWGLIDLNIKYINMRIVASTIQIITNDENTFNLA
ncbi:hypothetical protein HX088_11175, partial [Empedobacter sp. 225-1]|uniref:hypothetical protein n=1 Tax=Empedobacter sp. 225-1 TaxID=2746725 RepID=UPI002574A484